MKEKKRRSITGGENPASTREYWVYGTSSGDEAEAALLSFAPTAVSGLLARQSHTLDALENDETTWEATVEYGLTRAKQQPGGSGVSTGEQSFEITTENVNIKESFGRQSYAPSGQTAPAVKGVNDDGEKVNGVDKQVPVYSEVRKFAVSPSIVTTSFKAALYNAVGKVNSDTVLGITSGQVLFVGATGTQRDNEAFEITYRFNVQPNVTNYSVGDITGINKGGWQYIWARYEKKMTRQAKISFWTR